MNDSTERWRTLEDLYQAALGCEPPARAAFLNQACADESLRREVESLLNARGAGDELLERPAVRYLAQTLEPGATLGQYRIELRIGAGGMGEVYRAMDTRLRRSVALKVLPSLYAQDPAWLARFEREARVLASLNHSHIAAIYGVEERMLVMELVEGPTLAERLARRRMPLKEALPVARQIAEALEYAHEKGIIHRDLKPANIKITPEGAVKVLDFGLAKAVMPAEDTPTVTATRTGVVMGTPGYMAPEQARGMPVDKRADIWAFGVVLSEMIAGRDVPTPIRRLLKRCLEIDPKLRLRDIGEARIAIDEAQKGEPEEAAPATGRGTNRLLLAAVVLLTLLLGGTLIWTAGWFRLRSVPLGAAQFQIPFPEGAFPPQVSISAPELVPSPDGRSIAFIANNQKATYAHLWVQALTSATAQELEPKEARCPFWSPDGKSIAFFAGGQLKRVSMGGDVQIICNVPGVVGGNAGGTWNADGTIVFSPGAGSGMMRVPATGGNPTPATTLDPALGESAHLWPQFLPDGRHLLYFSPTGAGRGAIYVQELGSSRRTLVLNTPWRGVYASGYLLFVRRQALFAQPFDLRRFQLAGEPAPLVPYLNVNRNGWAAAFAASQNGVLAYNSDAAGLILKQLTWYDRAGRSLGAVGEVADYSNPALSPDGNWLVVGIRDPLTHTRDIWLLDLLRGAKSRVTSDPADDLNPAWSPDGSRIAFTSDRRGRREIYIKNPFGTAAEQLAEESEYDAAVEDWSPDGRWIAYNSLPTPVHIVALSIETRGTQLYTEDADHARFSPDGKWLAYRSPPGNSTGEVYIQPFPATGAKWQISTAGGDEPLWRGDGKELFYSTTANPAKLMAVDIAVKNGAIHPGIPHALFALQSDAVVTRNRWVVTRDGQKFLTLVVQEQKQPATRFGVIYNWPALLGKR